MPDTPVYALPFEQEPADPPGITLTGGEFGTEPILAEAVEAQLIRIDADVADARDEVAEVRDTLAWKRIDEGFHAGPQFSIPVPAGEFHMIRLHLRGHLDSLGTVRIRLNGDSAAGLHRTSIWSFNGAGDLYYSSQSEGSQQWQVAHWASTGGNMCTVQLYATNVTAVVGCHSTFGMMSAGTHQNQGMSAGRLNSSRLLTSLNIRPFSDGLNEFNSLHWFLEGWPVVT